MGKTVGQPPSSHEFGKTYQSFRERRWQTKAEGLVESAKAIDKWESIRTMKSDNDSDNLPQLGAAGPMKTFILKGTEKVSIVEITL